MPRPPKKPALSTTFATVFNEARARANLTVEEVAVAATLSKTTVYRAVEKPDQMKVDTLERIATALDVNPASFWGA